MAATFLRLGPRSGQILLIILLLLAGCSRTERAAATVSGVVTLDEKPVPMGFILFLSDNGQAASAELRADGNYSIQCPPGTYHVAVTPPSEPDPVGAVTPSGSTSTSTFIPRKYHEVGTSGIVTEIKQGQNTLNVELESRSR